MKISIALATYNGARYISEQLESLAAQTLPPFELVVGDDGSTDRTLDLLREFGGKVPFPVKVQRNPTRLGYSENFLQTISRCRGDWIALCDQDDVWFPRKLEILAGVACRRKNIIFCAHGATVVDSKLTPISDLNNPAVRTLRIYPPLAHRLWKAPLGFTEFFRRSLLDGLPTEKRPHAMHDKWIFWMANIMGETVFIPDRLALYRRHDTNITQHLQPMSARCIGENVCTQLASRSEHAEHRENAENLTIFAEYLRNCGKLYSGDKQERLTRGSEVISRLAINLTKRSIIWDSSIPCTKRLVVWLALSLRYGYASPSYGGMGWRACVKDLARLGLIRRAEARLE